MARAVQGIDASRAVEIRTVAMTITPALRKFAFTTHVLSSVGWLGAVLVFLAMAGVGLTSQDEATVRGAYLVMAPAAWFVLVPLAHASLLSGIVLSLSTTWGLIRHYWVVWKLLITVFSTVILLVYMGTFRQMAGVAADSTVDLHLVRNASPLLHASVALVLLLVATVLAVYKPLGMTAYGRYKQSEQRQMSQPLSQEAPSREAATVAVSRGQAMRVKSVGATNTPKWVYVLWVAAIAVVVLFVVLHLTGHVPRGH
jgi:hypothetical protein